MVQPKLCAATMARIEQARRRYFRLPRYLVMIEVGCETWSAGGYIFELTRTRWLWWAKLRLRRHLRNHPLRAGFITDINEERIRREQRADP